jgi:hypothetical protein
MIKRLMQHPAIRLLALIAVTPLLIGHGIGCLIDCSDSPGTSQRSHVISGSANPASSIQVGYNINVVAGSTTYTSPVSSAGGSVPPIGYSISGDGSHRIFVTVNDSDPVGSAIGEMRVHSIGKSIKLMHTAVATSYLNASFFISDDEYNLPQSSTIAGSSSYTLSGGSTGSEALDLRAPVEIYVNNVIIYTRNVTDNNVVAPIMFAASPDDELRILAGGVYPSTLVSSIWLHTPSGDGIKLSHAAMNRRSDSTGVFLDARYVLD